MFTRYVLPTLAILGFALAIRGLVPYDLHLESGRPTLRSKVRPAPPPVAQPPTRPSRFLEALHGTGLVEARRENIPIGAPASGIVPLFRIDGRELEAQLKAHEAALAAAEAQLRRLETMPRPEDLPPLRAAVEEAEARLLDAESVLARGSRLHQRGVIADSEFDGDRYARAAARAALDRAQAELEKAQAGAWEEDLGVQRAAVLQARAQVEGTRLLIDRLTVRAPVDGAILQVNVRPGQVAAVAWKEPMIVLGEVDRLHVRVDVDENDLHRFRPGLPGAATLKGRAEPEFPLEFVRVEPYVVPKRSLAGDNTERVDTRVLQVVYALPEDPPAKVYVGQQMDVFIDAAPSPPGAMNDDGRPPARGERTAAMDVEDRSGADQ